MTDGKLPKRITDKFTVDEAGCWIWHAGKTAFGYGAAWSSQERRQDMAHRLVWKLLIGPIPEGYELDHLCRVPACVNPEHLEAVTPWVNKMRAHSPLAAKHAQTHCKNGHELAGDNLIVRSDGHRRCRTCTRIRDVKRGSTPRQRLLRRQASA